MSGREPRWVDSRLVEAMHSRQLGEHGGTPGIRDAAGLDSALARPRQWLAYGGPDEADLSALAAAYALGIARNRPFVDGNKRTAYVVCRTFLVLNDRNPAGPLAERDPVFLGVAAGDVGEAEFIEWMRRNSRPLRVSESVPAYR